ncbi:hypothetical protein CF138_17300 [Aeromonas hydrophila]|uniref:hypothetical protein n=1 Tax=Aeromonas hydrophila TaxID=644 RepID=UPI001116B14F|nr:hypothetical protein [Aeromonas hydrophila]TNH82857.1 hypothetical protein CF138_17300 [Aeromonas hydrophila]TNI00242.1 hypothetical protein CF136_10605 [Aeromonas hydrophila]TNI92877.1 hypothetical protein CF118_18035 [Aeromonas hydrophila]
MNVMNYKLTPEQYAALHAAQEAGVQFDSYLLAPGERIWRGDFSEICNQMKDKGNYASDLQKQADLNKRCFEDIMRDKLTKDIIKHGNEMLALIKAQQYKGPTE